MSILNWKNKVLGHTLQGGGSSGGGGGGSPAPQQNTTYSSNVPEYARPYVENMLQSAQTQIYNDNMTSFRPYVPYSSNPEDYVAGYSPLQTQAQQAAYDMQLPGQFGVGTGLAGLGGMGALTAGTNYAAQATDPRTTQAYMSPYMQNVVDYQKSQALRDYQMGAPKLQATAVGQGAFGGNRLAIQQAEAQRGLMSQLQGIEATGAQQAYKDAQAQQQFGAQLGMQGYGQATQAGTALGQLGTQQQQAEQSLIGTKQQIGAGMQQQEQQKINQAIQDYATAQQYPFMQLGIMNAMLRGLPLQQSTTQQYQAAPNTLSQLSGLGLTGAAMYGMAKKKGGKIEEKKGSGLAALELDRLMSKKS